MRSDWLLSRQDFLVMIGHYETFSRLDGSFEFCEGYEREGENKKCRLKLTFLSIAKEGKFVWFPSHGWVSFGSVNMTSNDLLRAQTDIEKRFPFFDVLTSLSLGQYIKASV